MYAAGEPVTLNSDEAVCGRRQPKAQPQPIISSLTGNPAMPDRKTVVLVSHPGITHNLLNGILSSFTCVDVVAVVGALSAVDQLARITPDAVLIDANLPQEETLALLMHIKRHQARARCVVLTTTAREHSLLRSAGADVLLLDNCSLHQLEAAVCGTNNRSI
jgi:DNA-binding NarL/FixJ family response regulator